MSEDGARLAVIVPTLNEADHLPALLNDLKFLDADIVVVDGGSTDDTLAVAARRGVRVVPSVRGRGHQLQTGAGATEAEWLFFVHADCRLDAAARAALEVFLASAQPDEFAHFGFALDGQYPFHRFIEFGQRMRERLYGLVYGDQGLVVSRELYDRVGGHPDWPLMEDVGIVDRLTRVAKRTALPTALVTSARRYEREGRWSGWLRNVGLITLFRLGVAPERLARFYRPNGPTRRVPGSPRRIVIAFAKAPTPGRVKTRLAADVGEQEAVRIYRTMGRSLVDRLRGGPHRLLVYVDPPDAEAVVAVRAWLGQDIECRLQATGDLGERMAAAIDEGLLEADEVCVVGTDVPDIDAATIHSAFQALERADVVLGPSEDGGYYLVGMRHPHRHLFRDIAWSTDTVLAETMSRAAETNVPVTLLETLRDVDTLADVPQSLTAR